MNWFKTRLVHDGTWAIDDNGCDVMYLVSGEKKSLLIDTGWGIGDLPKLVASLSPLPLIVMNSHGHPDHTYGNSLFRQVHVHEADWFMVNQLQSKESRKWVIKKVLPKNLPEEFNLDMWATSVPSLTPVKDGYVFELGNRHLQTISVPGHSPGSVCLLDSENRLLFTGDTVQNPSWLHLDESLPLSQFHENLKRLQGFADKFDYVLPAHADLKTLPQPKTILDDLIAGIGKILKGEIVGRKEKTFAGDGLRCDFGSCGIVYRPDRLK
jgi:hydroxyacylglutathione hydrolase